MKNHMHKLREEGSSIKKEVRAKVIGHIVTALGLVAALAWNDAIRQFIDHVIPLGKDTLWAKFIYALIITVIVVVVSVYLSRLLIQSTENQVK